MDVSKMTKAQLLAMLQTQAAPTPPPVAKLAIPEAVKAALDKLVDSYVSINDDVSRSTTFRADVLKFGDALPADMKGKPLPEVMADYAADKARAALAATYENPEAKEVKPILNQKRSRAKSAFTCAPILPTAYAQGFKGTIQETLKLCTALKDNKYDLAATMQARAAQVNAPKDYGAYVAQVVAGILNAKGEIDALSAKAKAELVYWCDLHGINPKHAGEYRNLAIATFKPETK